MIVVAGSVNVRADKRASTVAAAVDMQNTTRGEPGCRAYGFSEDLETPNRFHVFEVWDDAAALDAHFTMPHFAAFSAAIADALEGGASFDRYEVSSARPLFG